jgi:hypothetical protein
MADLAKQLVNMGRFGEAADALDDLAAGAAGGAGAEDLRSQATALRARLN